MISLGLTTFSWFVLGIWYGWGYCLCTDWHWEVRARLGYHDMSDSYIHFLILELTGFNLSEGLVDTGTVVVFFTSLLISLWLNFRAYRRRVRR